MKTILVSLSFLFFSLPPSLLSQVEIEGVLRLGDTTQLLEIITFKGDRFAGSISSWQDDLLVFRLTTGDKVQFQIDELRSILVEDRHESTIFDDPRFGTHILSTREGRIIEGRLVSLNQRSLKIKYAGNRRAYFRNSNLEDLVFSPSEESRRTENYYRLRLRGGGKLYGHLISINDRFIRFQPEREKVYNYPRSALSSLTLSKSFRSMNGHQRSLLLSPTGFNLKKGEKEFRNINYIFQNSFTLGITDNVSGTVGINGYDPYIQIKGSYDFSPYLHLGAGGGVSITGAYGWFTAMTIGSPDYYLNVGYLENKGEVVGERTNMNAISFGGSMRIGNRQRVFAEVQHVAEKETLFEANGFGTNSFGFGFGWFSRRVSLNFAMMFVENLDTTTCFSPFFPPVPCSDDEVYIYSGIPVLSTSIMFGKESKKRP